jgi:hypothetical protein
MFIESLSDFFNENDFAEVALYDGSTQIRVIFDRAYLDQFGGMVAGARPVALGVAADFPVAAIGKTLVIKSVTYKIIAREPQDDGALMLLRLETV